MKKIKIIMKVFLTFMWILFFGIFTMLACSSCSHSEQQIEQIDDLAISQNKMFKVIYTNKNAYCVVYDVETKVEYAVSLGIYNRGTFTMLVDSTGKPKLYKE